MFPYSAGKRMPQANSLSRYGTTFERRLELLPTLPSPFDARRSQDRSYTPNLPCPAVLDKIIETIVRERESALLAEQEVLQLRDNMTRSIVQRLMTDLGATQPTLNHQVLVPLSPQATMSHVFPQPPIHQPPLLTLRGDTQRIFITSKDTSEMTQHSQRRETRGDSEIQDPHRGRQEHQRPAPRAKISERKNLNLSSSCQTPKEALRVLTALGSTLRSKSDPFIDTTEIQDPGLKMAPITPRRGTCEFFPDKLYRMLQEVDRLGLTDVVSFLPHGRAFRVHKPERFVNEVMSRYFSNLGKWSSFSRQCNLWGFLRVTSGCDENAYYHELFVRSHPDLCRFLRRVGVPHGLDRRKHKLPEGSDPEFWAMPSAPEFEAKSSDSQPPGSVAVA